MSSNEIRLRKNRISPEDISRHRNYGKLMSRHTRYLKMKRSIVVLVYFLIIVLMIMLYMLAKKMEPKKTIHPSTAISIEHLDSNPNKKSSR